MAFLLFMETKRKHLPPSWLLSLLCLHSKNPSLSGIPRHAKGSCMRKLFFHHNWNLYTSHCFWPLRTKARDQQPVFEEGIVEVLFLLTVMKQAALSVIKIKQPVHFLRTSSVTQRAGCTCGHFSLKRKCCYCCVKFQLAKHFSFSCNVCLSNNKNKGSAPNVVFNAMMRRIFRACNIAELCWNTGKELRYCELFAVGVWFWTDWLSVTHDNTHDHWFAIRPFLI